MTQWTPGRLLVAFTLYVAALLSIPSPARAEDTDIFFINPGISSLRPNVLIVLDNTSNWSSTDSVAGDGTKRFDNVRKALQDTVLGLDDRFNVGLMLFSETGAGNDNPDGGVIRAAVRQLTADGSDGPGYKTRFANLVGNLNDFDKGNNAKVGLAFYEAFQYFSGVSGGPAYAGANKLKRDWGDGSSYNRLPTSGNQADDNPQLDNSNKVWEKTTNALSSSTETVYTSPISDACQKNFIIFISNGTTQENSADINTATTFLATAGGDTRQISLTPNGLQNNVSDEWAKFLAITDPVNFPNKPNVISYAVEVNPILSGGNGPEWTAVMKSIAHEGKGKYFGVSSANAGEEIKKALDQIFAEVLAVNSVFASSTLPVSVNVRGTFLNQVYMGVFRPDSNASPRWPGNVKQYQLKPAGTALVLVDTRGQPIENKGFVDPNAISFWTKDETPGFWDQTYYPDTAAKTPLTPGPKDTPDGEFVEKGGAAQHLRMVYASDLTPRKLYTCLTGFCSSGDRLTTTTPDYYRFDAANTKITDTMLALSAPMPLTSLTRSGLTATGTTATAHGFTNGQVVAIKNAVDAEYNGIFTIAVTSSTTFTYPIVETPASPATATAPATIVASKGGTDVTISSMSRSTANDATSNSSTVSVTTSGNHGFIDNSSITISGALPDQYNGNWTIATGGPATNSFTFTLTTTPTTPATVSSGTATSNVIERVKGVDTPVSTVRNITGVTRLGTTVTVTTDVNHGFTASNTVSIAGVTPAPPYSGTFTIAATPSNRTFTYSLLSTAIGPGVVTTLGVARAPSGTLPNLSISRSGTTATATSASDPVAAGFANSDQVTITGADQPQYNGLVTISNVTSFGAGKGGSFQYTVVVRPPNSTTGATVEGGGVDRTTLINWIRGANTKLEDNPVNSASVVRGYLHGDVLHSRPAVVNYNRSTQPADRDIAVFYGSNDGIVHAVQGGSTVDDGSERWGFVPEDFFGRFARLYTATPKIASSTPRAYFADGPISVDAVYVKDGSAIERIESYGGVDPKVQLYIGMRRGGRFYYSLDVTDPSIPIFKWKISNSTAGFDELGQSWSDPKVVKIYTTYGATDPAKPEERKVLIFGAGYDAAALDTVTAGTATMGRGIYVVDAATGALIWFAGPTAPTTLPSNATFHSVSGMTAAIPADVAVINSDFDVRDRMDRIYASDTGGNIWRANIGDPDPANWVAYKVAALAGSAAVDKRRFLFAPDIVPFDDNWDSILIGSGDREQPFDTTIANRFYMIKDAHAMNAPAPTSAAIESELKDLTTSTVLTAGDKTDLAAAKGWMIRLGTGEKAVTGATTLASTTIFATNTPESVVSTTPGQCSGGLGKALIYAIDFKDATPDIYGVVGNVATARSTEREGGGFPPTPVPVSVKIDDKVYEGAITGTQVINPPLSVVGQRYRVFWNLSVDN